MTGVQTCALPISPHLIKNVRNKLRKHDFVNGQEVYSWSDISKFYDFDKEQPVRMAPKLTDKHLTLPAFSSMKVKLATQVLSHSVAAGISSLSTAGYLPEKSQNTAKFVEDMDQLFDIFNSKSIKSKKPYMAGFSGAKLQADHLQKMLNIFQNMKTNEGRSLPCFNGWQISIKSLQNLGMISAPILALHIFSPID